MIGLPVSPSFTSWSWNNIIQSNAYNSLAEFSIYRTHDEELHQVGLKEKAFTDWMLLRWYRHRTHKWISKSGAIFLIWLESTQLEETYSWPEGRRRRVVEECTSTFGRCEVYGRWSCPSFFSVRFAPDIGLAIIGLELLLGILALERWNFQPLLNSYITFIYFL